MRSRSNRPPPGQRQLVVWLDEDLKRDAQKLALDRDVTLSELVRTLIENELKARS